MISTVQTYACDGGVLKIDLTNTEELHMKELITLFAPQLYRARLGCVNFNHAASPVEAKV